MIVAKTQRLILSEVTLEDADFFVELMNTPKWIKYIGDRKISSENDAKQHLKKTILKCYKEHGFGFYKVCLKVDPLTIIGICGLIKREELEDVDIGFGFLPAYEGNGYGYESAITILKLAKEKFGIKRIAAITLALNTDSINLIQKLGMTFEKKVNPFEEDEELLLFAKNLE